MVDGSEKTHGNLSGNDYDINYFTARDQDRDRPALWFYERIACRWFRPGSVLDYGCGTGYLLRRLAKHFKVAGYDISPHARGFASKNVPSMIVYDLEEQIPSEYFSGIVSLHVLEHIDLVQLPQVLSLWHRSLLPHGRVLCVVPDAAGLGHRLAGSHWISFGDPSHVTLLGHALWRDLFVDAGFSVLKVGTDGLWCLPYRKGRGKIADGLRFSIPTLLQYVVGRLFLPAGSGESAIFILEKA